uniref:Non-structural polyprotein 1AB n=1 Tax=Eastern red scorpionfish astrovirus TaxID=2486207 RepID=A0A3G4R7P5_9VIRU|nr:RNA-dependent RNA-polymerase [Eastern red scorpionfish astrovirus]
MKQQTIANECQVGWCPVKRGLDLRLNLMKKGRNWFTTVDYTRYDGTIPINVLSMIRELRAEFLDIDDDEKDLLSWVNWNLLDKMVVLANGRVVKIAGGNPSGQVSTSVDNCLVNTYITAASNAEWYKENFGKYPTLPQLNAWTDQLVYGDDRIGSYDGSVLAPPPKDWVVKFFSDYFGMWVKPQNVVNRTTLEGLEFCGMRMHYDRNSSTWVGIYRTEKVKSSIVNPVKPASTPEIIKAKLASAKILLAYDDQAVSWIEEKERQVNSVVLTEFKSPTLSESKTLWTDQKELKELTKIIIDS